MFLVTRWFAGAGTTRSPMVSKPGASNRGTPESPRLGNPSLIGVTPSPNIRSSRPRKKTHTDIVHCGRIKGARPVRRGGLEATEIGAVAAPVQSLDSQFRLAFLELGHQE